MKLSFSLFTFLLKRWIVKMKAFYLCFCLRLLLPPWNTSNTDIYLKRPSVIYMLYIGIPHIRNILSSQKVIYIKIHLLGITTLTPYNIDIDYFEMEHNGIHYKINLEIVLFLHLQFEYFKRMLSPHDLWSVCRLIKIEMREINEAYLAEKTSLKLKDI